MRIASPWAPNDERERRKNLRQPEKQKQKEEYNSERSNDLDGFRQQIGIRSRRILV